MYIYIYIFVNLVAKMCAADLNLSDSFFKLQSFRRITIFFLDLLKICGVCCAYGGLQDFPWSKCSGNIFCWHQNLLIKCITFDGKLIGGRK